MSNLIPQDIIDRILTAADIVQIISEDVALKKQGVNYVGLCPFHNEKTPSFVVSPSKGIYHCFSCGKGGNVITYLQEARHLTFPEAVRGLGKRYNIDVPSIEISDEDRKKQQEKESTKIVINKAADLYEINLKRSPEAQAYLSSRKLTTATADRYGLGFAFNYNGLSKELIERGYESQYIIDSGVAYKSDEGTLHDSFYNRIIFPFYDNHGQVIGFDGRDITGNQPAKYKNTGDTLLFKKGNNLYGLYQARAAISKKDKVYIVEGQIDVLSMFQNGVDNVVAGSGTAFTDNQRRLLHNITTNIVFIYDGDAAGIKAAIKNLPQFIHDQFRVRCILLPDGKDADDIAKIQGEKLQEWLDKKEIDYVTYLGKTLLDKDDDEYQKVDKTKQILSVILQESEKVIIDKLYSKLYEITDYSIEQLKDMSSGINVPEAPDKFDPGFYGLDFIKDYIDPDDTVIHLVGNFQRFQKLIGEKQPYLFYHGMPSQGDIQELNQTTDRVIVHSPLMECDERKENSDCMMMKNLFKFGITVDICDQANQITGFIYYYIKYYAGIIQENDPTPETKNEYITRCAEMISYTRESIQTINMESWAGMLHLKQTALKEIIKPFNNERKSKRRIDRERGDVFNDLQAVDTDNVPEYVEKSEEYSTMLRRFNFYPLLNKDGTPVSYMFKNDSSSYHRVSDFYIEPLFHVFSSNKDENRRVIKLNSLYEKPVYVDWPSTAFVKLSTLQEMLVCLGGFNFESGTAQDYMRIWTYISHKFPKCTQIKVYGQQEEGCFLFANGILHQVDGSWKFEYCDELGIMKEGDTLFYSPSFSKVNVGNRSDDDPFKQEKYLVYTDTPEKKRTTFEHWASLMNEVYKINDNGKWALLFAIMCAFRSDIYPINRFFTSLFFIGPTESGKTQIAVSIRSLFVRPEASAFNLTSGTDAAFFSILEKFRDVPQIFEEYNDDMISDQKFQGLKDVSYDSNGKQKRKSATTNDVETTKVNAPVIILGQEAPQKDDNALTNRVVLCEVPKSDQLLEDHAQEIFHELKEYEKSGLSYLLIEILKLRPMIKEKFPTVWRSSMKEIQTIVEQETGSKSGDQTRIINTVSMFVAMMKILSSDVPGIQLPFTYEDFRRIAVDKIKNQVEMIVKTDKLAIFFNTIDYLIDKGSVLNGRDYKIEHLSSLKLKGGVDYTTPVPDTAILYMNLTGIHKMYEASLSRGDKPLTLTTLKVNIKSNAAYIGQVDGTKFRWYETKEIPMGGTYTDAVTGEKKPNMTVTRIREKQEKSTSAVVLNYDILKAYTGIDLERAVGKDEEPQEEKKQPEQDPSLPF